ncbi:sugar fermentation stimulation protein homolog [Striga asiatica]|uniref:Sugar fermentation stimulation protein homolog n=1 Tax=Striga asiatica TaxID=4170 RepID=A0A5A7Q7U4_STRAF|nr:sugar fermentation stimulation protein homolog [Striga asiatica]
MLAARTLASWRRYVAAGSTNEAVIPSEIWSAADRMPRREIPNFRRRCCPKTARENQLAIDSLINQVTVCSIDVNVTEDGRGGAGTVGDGARGQLRCELCCRRQRRLGKLYSLTCFKLRTMREGYSVDVNGTEDGGVDADGIADECGGAVGCAVDGTIDDWGRFLRRRARASRQAGA